ncbi:dynamin family protein [Marinococcus sp. PL1-022]|uniref:dynamin family protein n=1 Tax=Marinococcus sp. PL1-022 TaxID=3095363 RepID=UPI0029C42410|nr:dynamin family protein [Marinococcus sp. PL1-022]MDX6152967.1 dynamin family protein [Marinococcus sp. PL1-022]
MAYTSGWEQQWLQTDMHLDPAETAMLEDVQKKIEHPYFEVAFCGHFSAGKSTVLNGLLQNELLPASPIPTSANIISIENGELGLEVETGEGQTKAWESDIPWGQVQKWGRDAADIRSIRMQAPLPFLGSYSRMVDTPGVDSTDPLHQAVTMERLLSTDAVIYVTDYNHAQSETNIRFLQQLTAEGKPIIFVINQMDKHREEEITMRSYRNQIAATLERNQVHVLATYYISMRDEQHPDNELKTFSSHVRGLLYHGSELLERSEERMRQTVLSRIRDRLREEQQTALEDWQERAEHAGLPAQLMDYNDQPDSDERWSSWFREWKRTLNQAHLFPASTVDKARDWLESWQPGFKAGSLFNKKRKTEEARKERAEALLSDINENIKASLTFHVRELLQPEKQDVSFHSADYADQVQNIDVQLEHADLEPFIPEGETGRQYVFQVTDQLAGVITRRFKDQAEPLLEEKERVLTSAAGLALTEAEQTKLNELQHGWKEEKKRLEQEIAQVERQMESVSARREWEQEIRQMMNEEAPSDVPEISISREDEAVEEQESASPGQKELPSYSEEIQMVESFAADSSESPLIEEEKKHLQRLCENLQNQELHVSVFGAFSAGKSSFINALLGAPALPVSPHPTTAAVNIVRAPEKEYTHGTVILQLKDEAFLDEEIQAVSKELGEVYTLASIQKWRKPNRTRDARMETYSQYMFTLQESIKKHRSTLGETRTIGMEDWGSWVADEQKACLVKQVTLYYGSYWTDRGLVLTDTPGVNSIHGRHTNVAFDHLRQSDAIFYVTYFNHAFSDADERFIQQLSRANEEFEQNKLYFLINAADLAKDENERRQVVNHVRGQLRQNGFEEPFLLPVSSQRGLEEKQQGREDEMFSAFENYLSGQIWQELLVVQQQYVIEQALNLKEQLGRALQVQKHDAKSVAAEAERLKQKLGQYKEVPEHFHMERLRKELASDTEERLIHVRKRLYLFYQDYFNKVVNPVTIDGSSRKEQRRQLSGRLMEIKEEILVQAGQERETAFIRLEELMKRQLKQETEEQYREVQADFPMFQVPDASRSFIPKPEKTLDLEVDAKAYETYFRSAKDFFVHQEIKTLKEAYGKNVQSAAAEVTKEVAQELEEKIEAGVKAASDYIYAEHRQALDKEFDRLSTWYDQSYYSVLQTEWEKLAPLTRKEDHVQG